MSQSVSQQLGQSMSHHAPCPRSFGPSARFIGPRSTGPGPAPAIVSLSHRPLILTGFLAIACSYYIRSNFGSHELSMLPIRVVRLAVYEASQEACTHSVFIQRRWDAVPNPNLAMAAALAVKEPEEPSDIELMSDDVIAMRTSAALTRDMLMEVNATFGRRESYEEDEDENKRREPYEEEEEHKMRKRNEEDKEENKRRRKVIHRRKRRSMSISSESWRPFERPRSKWSRKGENTFHK